MNMSKSTWIEIEIDGVKLPISINITSVMQSRAKLDQEQKALLDKLILQKNVSEIKDCKVSLRTIGED